MLRDINQLKAYIDTQIQNIETIIPNDARWSLILALESQDYNQISLLNLEKIAKERLKNMNLDDNIVLAVHYRGYDTTVPETYWRCDLIRKDSYIVTSISQLYSTYQKYAGSLRYYILKVKKKFKNILPLLFIFVRR